MKWLLYALCVSLTTVAAPASATEQAISDAFTALSTFTGEKYAAARADFLARDDAPKFLEMRLNGTPDDWLAFALVQRLTQKKFAEMFDEWSRPPRVEDSFAATAFDEALFSWAAHNQLSRRTPVTPFFSSSHGGAVNPEGWMADYSLEMEWLIRNPHGFSQCARFWWMYGLCWYNSPIPSQDFSLWADCGPRTVEPPDAKRIVRWLESARDREKDPIVRLLIAGRLSDEKSAAVLLELAQEDSLLGTLAAFFYAGRDMGHQRSGGHSYNAEWLDRWAAKAGPRQRQAVEWIFAKDYSERPPLRLNGFSNPPDYQLLRFPLLSVGVILKHQEPHMSAELKRRYVDAVQGQLETFVSILDGYTVSDDQDRASLKWATRVSALSPLWPASAAAEFDKIVTKDRRARELLEKARGQLGERTYPEPADLQAFFDSPSR